MRSFIQPWMVTPLMICWSWLLGISPSLFLSPFFLLDVSAFQVQTQEEWRREGKQMDWYWLDTEKKRQCSSYCFFYESGISHQIRWAICIYIILNRSRVNVNPSPTYLMGRVKFQAWLDLPGLKFRSKPIQNTSHLDRLDELSSIWTTLEKRFGVLWDMCSGWSLTMSNMPKML